MPPPSNDGLRGAENPESWLSELIQDLGQRKVDTIVARDGITGRAMPDPVNALLDIHNSYLRRLITLGLAAAPDRTPEAFDSAGWLLPNEAARKWLVGRALAGMGKSGLKPVDACVLQRILSTCIGLEPVVAKVERQLPTDLKPSGVVAKASGTDSDPKAAFRAYYREKRSRPDIELTRKDRAALSKAWELGTDTVALQTIAMLGGDVITRITEQYTGDAHVVVRQIHNQAVETSLSTWDRLVHSVTSLFEGLLGSRR